MVSCACNPSYSGGWGTRITWTQEVDIAMSRDHALHSSLGARGRLYLKKKTKKKYINCSITLSSLNVKFGLLLPLSLKTMPSLEVSPAVVLRKMHWLLWFGHISVPAESSTWGMSQGLGRQRRGWSSCFRWRNCHSSIPAGNRSHMERHCLWR